MAVGFKEGERMGISYCLFGAIFLILALEILKESKQKEEIKKLQRQIDELRKLREQDIPASAYAADEEK